MLDVRLRGRRSDRSLLVCDARVDASDDGGGGNRGRIVDVLLECLERCKLRRF